MSIYDYISSLRRQLNMDTGVAEVTITKPEN